MSENVSSSAAPVSDGLTPELPQGADMADRGPTEVDPAADLVMPPLPPEVMPPKSEIAQSTEMPPPKSRRMRLHRLWPSDNRFCCCGFLMTGAPSHSCSSAGCLRSMCGIYPGAQESRWSRACQWCIDGVEGNDTLNYPTCTALSGPHLCAWFCILVPSVLYFVLALPYYWTQVHFLLPLAALFFFTLTSGCLLFSCLTDPGIIPRREVILAEGSADRLEKELGFPVLGVPDPSASEVSRGDVKKIVPPELQDQGYRWCYTCNIVRPPRASHCVECDNCVLRFDHHCPFINNCVGQRNYLFFFGFTTSVCCLAVTVLPFLAWYIIQGFGSTNEDDGSSAAQKEVDNGVVLKGVIITLVAAGGLVATLVISLWFYHIFLICSGLTTKEHWKGKKTQDMLPGYGEELTIFGRRGPRLYNPRAVVDVIERIDAEGRRRLQIGVQSAVKGDGDVVNSSHDENSIV